MSPPATPEGPTVLPKNLEFPQEDPLFNPNKEDFSPKLDPLEKGEIWPSTRTLKWGAPKGGRTLVPQYPK